MDINSEVITWTIGGALSAGVAFGIVRGKLHNFVTFEKHREICEKEREKTDKITQRIFDKLDQTNKLVSEIHGYLTAKNGGSL
jgi:hypothetical protein